MVSPCNPFQGTLENSGAYVRLGLREMTGGCGVILKNERLTLSCNIEIIWWVWIHGERIESYVKLELCEAADGYRFIIKE